MNPNGAPTTERGPQLSQVCLRSSRAGFGTGNASDVIVSHCALLAEPDRALRDLMRRILAAAGYDVLESSNVLQLEVGLRVSTVFGAKNVVFVLGARLAMHCALSIAAASRERARVRLPQAHAILTYEFGTVAATPHPELAPCVVRGILEKPFDLQALHAMALDCQHLSLASVANGALS